MVLDFHHADIFGDTIVITGSMETTARCSCGVINSARDAWEIEAWALSHENYLHQIDLDAVIGKPNGLEIGREFFSLVRSTEQGRDACVRAFGKTVMGPDMAESLLAWVERQLILITGVSVQDEEWLSWLGVLANRRLTWQTVAAK